MYVCGCHHRTKQEYNDHIIWIHYIGLFGLADKQHVDKPTYEKEVYAFSVHVHVVLKPSNVHVVYTYVLFYREVYLSIRC